MSQQLSKSELLRRIGHQAQLCGARHYILNDGTSQGLRAIDIDTGSGFCFTILPDRGLDISRAAYRGTNLVYLTPNGEVNSNRYEPEGLGWLRTFFAGLVTTCGLTYLGPPGVDGDVQLGLHGRYSNTPARQVCDNSHWDGDDYIVEISGIMEECALFMDKLRSKRTVSTCFGSKRLRIEDQVENFGYAPAPFTILYHINAGYPLLSAASELHVGCSESHGCNDHSREAEAEMFGFADPIPGFQEQNFLHTIKPDADGCAWAAFVNPELDGGLGLCLKFDAGALPNLNEWKMMGEGDYVVGVEPCNVPCENRAVLREKGLLPMLQPGETTSTWIEIGILDGAEEIGAVKDKIKTING